VNSGKALLDACLLGDLATVRRLIHAGADPNTVSRSRERYRPLHRAIEQKKTWPRGPQHLEIAKFLLDHGADVNAPGGPRLVPPLAMAAIDGSREFVDLILSYKPRIDIFAAAVLCSPRLVGRLLKSKPALVSARDHEQRIPLHYCAASGLYRRGVTESDDARETARIMIDAGADVNAAQPVKEHGEIFPLRPLWYAVLSRNRRVARLLLECGAEPDGIFAAAFAGDIETLSLLAEFGAPVDPVAEGETPLLHVLHWRRPRAVKWLLDQGANPNVRGVHGRTALHWAASNGVDPRVIADLLDHGAKRDARDDAGNTPYGLAVQNGKVKIAHLLRPRGTVSL
jgi:ankyrin repeat protein